MKLTTKKIREMVMEEMRKITETEEIQAKGSMAMRTFVGQLVKGETISASVVRDAREAMEQDPSKTTMISFISITLNAFGIDQQEFAAMRGPISQALPEKKEEIKPAVPAEEAPALGSQ